MLSSAASALPSTRPSRAPSDKLLLAGFGALIAVGCFLRFWKLGDDGLWYDELWTVVGASDRPFMEMVREWALGDPHPPGYFLFYFAWLRLFPNDELWARLPNAIAGTLTVLYLLLGTTRVLSRDERVFASTFASFSWLYLFYAVNVKQYSAVILLATVATILYLQIVHERRVDRRAGLALAATLVALEYLNHFGMAYAWVLLGLLAITFRGTRAVLRSVARIALVLAVAYAPIAFSLYFTLSYSVNTEPSRLATLLSDLAPSLFFEDRWFVSGSIVALTVALVRGRRPALRSSRNLHLLAILASFTGLLLAVSLTQPIFLIRYFVLLFPAALLGMAILTARAFPISSGWLAVLPLIFFARAAVVDFRGIDGMQRQEWARSVDEVLGWRRPGDAIYVLGANPDRSMLDYLKAGDIDGVVYSKNVDFYEYYFRRRGAAAVASHLRVVEPTVASAAELAREYRGSGMRVFVLAGHHIEFDDEALWTLEQASTHHLTSWLYSTIVYEYTF